MPIIEEIDDSYNEEINFTSLKETIESVISSLRVPRGFQDPDWAIHPQAASLIAWRNTADASISKIRSSLENIEESVDDDLFKSLISLVVPFTGSGAWVKAETRQSAEKILSLLSSPSQRQIRSILTDVVKPAFVTAPQNNQIHPVTANRVNHATASHSTYYDDEDNLWKTNIGLVDIILWCLKSFQESDWESLWPLLIPPILTYLDDWQIIHRLSGVGLARNLIERAPKPLFIRSGINELIRSSLETSLLRYSDDLSPLLFKQSMLASLELVEKTTAADSPERYQKLFALLGDSIIGGAWTYGYREPLLIQATYEVLPRVLQALGVACVRYLKAMVPQLLHTLVPLPEATVLLSLQEASARALCEVIRHGEQRMEYWSGEIVSGIAKCWVSLDENRKDSQLGRLLIAVVNDLRKACPEIIEKHTETLQQLDKSQFSPLFATS